MTAFQAPSTNTLTSAQRQNLVNIIKNLPTQFWQFTPLISKKAVLNNWTKNTLTKEQAIEAIALNPKYTGIGVVTGKGLLALDCDGESSLKALEWLISKEITSVTSTSGRPGRQQIFFIVPTDYIDKLPNRRVIKTGNSEQLEIRYNGNQSVLPGSLHPDTGKPYYWLNSPTQTKLLELTPEQCEKIINLPSGTIKFQDLLNPPKTKPPLTNQQNSLDNFRLPVNQTIPLGETAIAPCTRNWINYGVNEGTRNDTAFKVAADLIGATNYLNSINQSFDGDGDQLFDEFCCRCTPAIDSKEREQIWNSAINTNPQPSLDEDKIKNNIYWWLVKQNQFSTNKSNKVTPLNEPNSNDPPRIDLGTDINKVIEENLTGSVLNTKLTEIASNYRSNYTSVRSIYEQKVKELENLDNLPETSREIAKLISAKNTTIKLEDFLPSKLAKNINELAKNMAVESMSYVIAIMAQINTLFNPNSYVLLDKTRNFKVYPGLFAALVAPSSQKKSPIQNAAINEPMEHLNHLALQKYEREIKEYNRLLLDFKACKPKDRSDCFPDGEPTKPVVEIFHTSNTTIEALFKQFEAYPSRGILINTDELAKSEKGKNQYKRGGNDHEVMLELYDGKAGNVLRVGESRILPERVLLSQFGSIQPQVFKQLLGDGQDNNGYWARFIIQNQPVCASTIDPYAPEKPYLLGKILTELYETIESEQRQAKEFTLTQEARVLFCLAYNELEQLRVKYSDTCPAMSNVYGKSEGRIGKFCLFLKAIEQDNSTEISAETMEKAISLNNYFNNQVFSLYSELTNSDDLAPQLVKVLEIVAKQNGFATTRVIHNSWGNKKTRPKTSEILELFNQLVDLGLGEINKKGRTIEFKLSGAKWGKSGAKTETIINKEFEDILPNNGDISGAKWGKSGAHTQMDETIINKEFEDALSISGASGASISPKYTQSLNSEKNKLDNVPQSQKLAEDLPANQAQISNSDLGHLCPTLPQIETSLPQIETSGAKTETIINKEFEDALSISGASGASISPKYTQSLNSEKNKLDNVPQSQKLAEDLPANQAQISNSDLGHLCPTLPQIETSLPQIETSGAKTETIINKEFEDALSISGASGASISPKYTQSLNSEKNKLDNVPQSQKLAEDLPANQAQISNSDLGHLCPTLPQIETSLPQIETSGAKTETIINKEFEDALSISGASGASISPKYTQSLNSEKNKLDNVPQSQKLAEDLPANQAQISNSDLGHLCPTLPQIETSLPQIETSGAKTETIINKEFEDALSISGASGASISPKYTQSLNSEKNKLDNVPQSQKLAEDLPANQAQISNSDLGHLCPTLPQIETSLPQIETSGASLENLLFTSTDNKIEDIVASNENVSNQTKQSNEAIEKIDFFNLITQKLPECSGGAHLEAELEDIIETNQEIIRRLWPANDFVESRELFVSEWWQSLSNEQQQLIQVNSTDWDELERLELKF